MAAGQIGVGRSNMCIVPEVKELFDVDTGSAKSTDPAPGEVVAEMGPRLGQMGHVFPAAEARGM
jgi:hypothetical protein